MCCDFKGLRLRIFHFARSISTPSSAHHGGIQLPVPVKRKWEGMLVYTKPHNTHARQVLRLGVLRPLAWTCILLRTWLPSVSHGERHKNHPTPFQSIEVGNTAILPIHVWRSEPEMHPNTGASCRRGVCVAPIPEKKIDLIACQPASCRLCRKHISFSTTKAPQGIRIYFEVSQERKRAKIHTA